jgi:excisionase family DNA binding protein
MTEQRLFSIEEAAAYLGISPRSVRTFIASSQLPAIRLGRRVLLDKEQLDKWIASQDACRRHCRRSPKPLETMTVERPACPSA